MIGVPVFILLTLLGVRLRKGVFAAFLVLVSTKSIMDSFWDIKFGPLSMLSIQGILIPILFYKVYKYKKRLPLYWVRTANLYLLALSFGLFWSLISEPFLAIEILVLNINIYLGFFIIPLVIENKTSLRKTLIALMICGVFPMLVSLYQLQTGVIFNDRATVGLTRYVGFYHDAFPVRFYGLMTLFAVFIYLNNFKVKRIQFKIFMVAITIGAFISIYLVFSKAAVAILGVWFILLLLFSNSRFKYIFSVLLAIMVLFLVFGDAISSNVGQLFSKEVGYQSGEVKDARYTLAGRGYIWQDFWRFWINEQNSFFQWVGDGLNRPAHNEWLRVLLMNGILGLIFLLFFNFRIFYHLSKMRRNVLIFGLMLMAMYSIDSIGLVPGVYYYYNILVWGIFGLLLIKPHFFIKR